MAQKFVSPGVFTEELDQSFLAQGVGAIGAVLIGQTMKGPAFTPTKVGSFQEFVDKFGDLNLSTQLPYAAKNYLKNAATMTVVRVLGDANGTSVTNLSPELQANVLYVSGASGNFAQAVIFTSGALFLSASGATYFISASGMSSLAFTASNNYGSSDHWLKVLNSDPTKFASKGHFVYQVSEWNLTSSYNSYVLGNDLITAATDFRNDYAGSSTSMITSQFFGGNTYDLFKFYTKAEGAASTDEIKVSISNIKPSVVPDVTKYGTFDIAVRVFGDTDQRPQVIESFTQCTLDPNSQNYVARLIGNQYEWWNTVSEKLEATGTFQSKSKYVRIEMQDSGAPEEALPFGHSAYTYVEGTIVGLTGALPLVANQTNAQGNIDSSIHWGIDFSKQGIDEAMKFLPTEVSTSTGSLQSVFNLGKIISGTYQNKTTWSYSDTMSSSYTEPMAISASLFKFTVPFKGGFDGFDITTSTPLSVGDSDGDTLGPVVWLKKGVSVVSNPDQYDFNIMALPGITNYKVNDFGRQVCNDRADSLFIMDIPGASVVDTISKINNRTIDDNYATTYYPDLTYNDKVNNRLVKVKPSVAVLGAIAYNDRVGQPFFAPAGLNRGGLGQFDIVDVADRLTYAERSDLYDARVNPIATFPQEGIVIFGQKTLQVKPSALDRVNVRRLLIYAKKLIASAAKYILFEPNNPNTWQRFLNEVNPILDKIRQDQGIERFKVVMDSTVNTPDVIDRNIMKGKIFLQPTRTAEFIDLSFIITSSGVSFEE